MKISVNEVGLASKHVATAALDLASGSAQQAAGVEQTSATLELMNGVVKQNAESAKQTEAMAVDASRQAETGGSKVTETVDAMRDILTKTEQFTVIDTDLKGVLPIYGPGLFGGQNNAAAKKAH